MGHTKTWASKRKYVPHSPLSPEFYPTISLGMMKPNLSMMHEWNPYVNCR